MNLRDGNNHKSRGFTPKNPQKIPATDFHRTSFSSQNGTPEKLRDDETICREIEVAIEAVEILTALPSAKDNLETLLQEKDSYRKKLSFKNPLSNVSLNESPKGKNLLEGITSDFRDRLLALNSADAARDLLSAELDKVGLTLDKIDYNPPISHDTRHIIRMEFDGSVRAPDENNLSEAYLELKNNPPTQSPNPKEYNLEESDTWKTFAKFPNFRNQESEFRAALAWGRIPPDKLQTLNAFDFEDLLFQHKQEINGTQRSSYRLFEGARESAVKIHTHNHRQELYDYFMEMGAQENDINYVLQQMELKGKIPPLALANGDYLTANVHHDTAILDAHTLTDITLVNSPANFRIIFKKNGKDDENTVFATQEKNLADVFQQHKIPIDNDVDLNLLYENPEQKAAFIKKLAKDKMEALYSAFKQMGIEKPETPILEMFQTGKFPQLDLPRNRFIGLDLKQTKQGLHLVFSSKEKPSSYTDIHASIFHGLRTSPVYMEVSADGQQAGHQVIATEGEEHPSSEKGQAYALESEQQTKQSLLQKVMFRIHSKKRGEDNPQNRFVAFILGGLSKSRVISSNEKDTQAAEKRQQMIESGNKYYDSAKGYKYER